MFKILFLHLKELFKHPKLSVRSKILWNDQKTFQTFEKHLEHSEMFRSFENVIRCSKNLFVHLIKLWTFEALLEHLENFFVGSKIFWNVWETFLYVRKHFKCRKMFKHPKSFSTFKKFFFWMFEALLEHSKNLFVCLKNLSYIHKTFQPFQKFF